MSNSVARAIFAASAPYQEDCCANPDFDKCPCRTDAVEQARAAIEAMRLMPTPQLIGIPVTEVDQETAGSSFTPGEVKAVWLAMLAEALK